jgi:hypothetical protein
MHIMLDDASNNLPAKKFFYFIRECQIDSPQSIVNYHRQRRWLFLICASKRGYNFCYRPRFSFLPLPDIFRLILFRQVYRT